MNEAEKQQERIKEAARRLAAMIGEPGPTKFEEWASAVMLTSISMAQFIGMPKASFLKSIGSDWDEWADTPDSHGGIQ